MSIFNKLFPSDNEKRLKKLSALADKVLTKVPEYDTKTDDELRACTENFKKQVANGVSLDDLLVDAYAVVYVAVKRVLGFELFKVQIMGGIALHQGRIAEMLTGEGKTVVETMPAYLNALSGKGVHIVTVNDYLADRDAGWMGGVYRLLGLSVGLIKTRQEPNEKKEAYLADITYGTNSEFGFDYLRDNMQISLEDICQRELNFAIVDEVDSILIDEARTPLIIAGRVMSKIDMYKEADVFAKKLQASTYVPTDEELKDFEEADGDYVINEKDKGIMLTTSGAVKAEKAFHVKSISDEIELYNFIRLAIKANFIMKKDRDYVVMDDEIFIVDEFTGRLMDGRRFSDGLHQAIEAKEGVTIKTEDKTFASISFQNYFRLYKKLSGMTGTAKIEEQEFLEIYGTDIVCIPPNKEVMRIDETDKVFTTMRVKLDAIVKDIAEAHNRQQPVLVGTPSVEKSEELSELLKKANIPHLLLNAKNFREEAMIIAQAGRLGSVTVATNMAGRGTDIILGGNPSYYTVKKLEEEGIDPEFIDKTLHTAEREFTPEMRELKEKYNKIYAEISNVFSREREEVKKVGGLRIIGTEKNENRRIDIQLRGRAGRQGDVGSSVYYLSFEDDLLRIPFEKELADFAERENLSRNEPIDARYVHMKIKDAQNTLEQRHYSARRHVLAYDDVLNKQREAIYKARRDIIDPEKTPSIHGKILGYIVDYVAEIVQLTVDFRTDYRHWNYDELNEDLNKYLMPKGTRALTISVAAELNIDSVIDEVLRVTKEKYEEKREFFIKNGLDFDKQEKEIYLALIDSEWINQMDNMQNLKNVVSLKAIGQINPITAYQIEGMKFFDAMILDVRKKTVATLLKLGEANIETSLGELQHFPDELVSARKDNQGEN